MKITINILHKNNSEQNSLNILPEIFFSRMPRIGICIHISLDNKQAYNRIANSDKYVQFYLHVNFQSQISFFSILTNVLLPTILLVIF